MSLNKVIQVLGIPRSTVFYKKKSYSKRKSPQRKVVSEELKIAIFAITKKKATYGVPRVLAILKRDYNIQETKYLVHRFMKEEGLLIKKNRRRGSNRPHTGKVAVKTSNTRWASDITSIKCWNGQKLRVAIVIDCCDRSIISWKAGAHMQACDIELMIQEALFNRFGESLPEKDKLEFLHDNGPEYIEKGLKKQLAKWNIKDCNTPKYSPQSNGICESFNGTFKRDYVYENCLDTPEIVMNRLQEWFNEYNSYAPHSALKMKTPQEFYNFKIAA